MKSLITYLRTAARQRALYNRTASEIMRMPADIARDLNIYPGDAHHIARQIVYGDAA